MKRRAFTIIEVMIVVIIIGLLMGIAIPNFLSSRSTSQFQSCQANMRTLENAKEMWAIDNRVPPGTGVTQGDLWPDYVKGPTFPRCPGGGSYTLGNVGTVALCSIVSHNP